MPIAHMDKAMMWNTGRKLVIQKIHQVMYH
jgi:hypothetical protein